MWLTPVELFAPYYSNVFANFVSSSMKPMLESKKHNSDGFQIVELGGGRGTNAKALLNHLQLHHDDVYDKLTEYTIFDASPTLHELQRQNLMIDSDHADKINLVNVDIMDIAEGFSSFLQTSDVPTALIALEVLDNLPHDKIAKCFETDGLLQAELFPVDDDCAASETIVDTSKQYHEAFSPVSDPLLQQILSIDPSLSTNLASNGPRWIPSVALGVLMRLFECRPNSAVALADFDWLPPPDLSSPENQVLAAEPAIGDPIVTDCKGIDHPCYLTTPPDELCDILYPTDFTRIASFTRGTLRRDNERRAMPISVATMKQNDFLLQYGLDEVNKTKSWTGYSPMIEDFGNCSVLTVTPHHLCK